MQAMADSDGAGEELFATETMAELCARQGRLAEAAAIFSRLLRRGPGDDGAGRWAERLAALEAQAANGIEAPSSNRARPAPAGTATAPASMLTEPSGPSGPPRMPLVIHQTVRSGQLVYAQGTDLIVLAPVNPGAQLLADGNIHVYATLRGRAVAGARGARDARIFCQRLDAELVGVDAAYLTAESLPPERVGKPAQVLLDGNRCVVAAL
jgi:septum site-determining protein MinC